MEEWQVSVKCWQKKVGFKLNLQWKGKYDDTWSKFLRMGQVSNILFDKCMNE